jgi:hypothetical protein
MILRETTDGDRLRVPDGDLPIAEERRAWLSTTVS